MQHYLIGSDWGNTEQDYSTFTTVNSNRNNDRDVAFVRGPEWEGLYINGLLVAEGQYLTPEQILDALDQEYEFVDVEASNNYIHVLPYDLDDLLDRMEEEDYD